MKTVGVIGLGDVGSGLARNLIKMGFATTGLGLAQQLGGDPCHRRDRWGDTASVEEETP